VIEIVPLSPENELPVAQRLLDLIVREWPDLVDSNATGRVRIFVGAHMLFDIDLLVEVSLAHARPVASVMMRGGAQAPATSIVSALIAIEVKQQSRERFQIAGTEIFPLYGRTASKRSVAKQVADGTIATLDFVKRYSDERIFVHSLGWLTDMPDAELKAAPAFIVGRDSTWSSLLQAAATRSTVLFTQPTPEYRRAIETIGSVLSRRRRAIARDRAAVDRLTSATIADGKFDDVREALGQRQVRLAGRAGSGKSTTLALLAEYIACVRQERLLVLTYNHALCHEIERLIRTVVNDDALIDRHVRVATLVDFLADACTELGADISSIEGRIDYQQVEKAFSDFLAAQSAVERRADAEVLKELEPERFGFDYVCVDEAQDCFDSERDILRILYPSSSLVLADGLEQLIRRQTPCDWTTGIKKDARLHVDLSRSLRMSGNVADFVTATARAMGLDGWRITPHPDLFGGRIIVVAGTYDTQLLQELIGSLDEANLPRKDLLVCVPPGEIVAVGARRDSRITLALQSWGYRTWNGCDEIVRRSEVPELDQIRVVQYDSMRGLEGWCTLLVGLDAFYSHRLAHPNLKAGEGTTPEQVARRWMLMALTRAAHTLTITLDDPSSAVAGWLRSAAATLPRDLVEWREAR
jgi:hypothetical protein